MNENERGAGSAPWFRWLSALLLILSTVPALQAHPLLQNSMWVLAEEGDVRVAVDVSLREIGLVQGIASAGDNDYPAERFAEAAERHGDYVLSKLEVTSGGKTLTGSITTITPPPLYGAIEQTHFQYEIAYPREQNAGEVAVRQTMLQDLPLDETGQPWEISYVARFKNPGSDAVSFLLVAPGARVVIPSASAGNTGLIELPPAPVDVSRTVRDYFHHGLVHILTGYDHLLFVSALVLGALTFWQLFKVIAAFTIAHTITLALSVLDVVRLPSSIVEPIIAGSIIFVAVENLFWPQRAQSKLRLVIAFAFGLVHGLGFAGGLLEAMEGLPALGLGLALAAFSVGVEAGHLAVVIPLFAIIQLVRSRNAGEATPLWRRWASGAISLCGVYYFVGALGGW